MTSWPDDVAESADAHGIERFGVVGLGGPLHDDEGILYAELGPERLREERHRFDPVGHHRRSDVFSRKVRSRS